MTNTHMTFIIHHTLFFMLSHVLTYLILTINLRGLIIPTLQIWKLKLNSLPKVTLLVSGRAGMKT